jgi:hypothetical protein
MSPPEKSIRKAPVFAGADSFDNLRILQKSRHKEPAGDGMPLAYSVAQP